MLDADERRRHLYVVGQTGTGKSTLLLNLIRAGSRAPARARAARSARRSRRSRACAHVPRARTNDLVYINPADIERPIGFNPLSRVPRRPQADRRRWRRLRLPACLAGQLGAAARLHSHQRGARAARRSRRRRLLMLPRLLIDEPFRVQLIEHHVADPVVRSFWLNEYAGYSDSFRDRGHLPDPEQDRQGAHRAAPAQHAGAAEKHRSRLRRLMDEGAIVICNLSKGGSGESTAHLLGALITTAIAQAALSRADTPAADRRVFHLYADEFQSFATESFALILSEARKYALTLTIAHQYLDQLPDRLRAAVFGNAGSIIACRTGARTPRSSPSRSVSAAPTPCSIFRTSPLGHGCSPAACRPRRSGSISTLRRVPAAPIQPAGRHQPHRFGRPRAEVEARISRFLAA